MDRLHAYWRMPYIQSPKPRDDSGKKGGNPFVEMGKSDDFRKNYIIWRGKYSFIVMNKFPYNCGHLLVLPLREITDLGQLDQDERCEFFDAIIKAEQILRSAIAPDAFNIGFNIGAKAGAGIPQHLHCHIVPRWDGDTNFMPVISDTKVLPESLDALWQKLVQFA